MTDAERALIANLTAARLPLAAQIVLGAVAVLGYWYWSRTASARVDAAARTWLGARIGATVIWVRRNTADYPTPFQFRAGRYARWTWGIADEPRRTFGNDAIVSLADLIVVRIAAGAAPVAVLLYLTIAARLVSYVVFLPVSVIAIGIYAMFWTGRYRGFS